MLITSNSKNIFNESKKSKQIFFSYQESFDLNSYKRLQDAIISNDLNKLEKELKSGNNPNNQNNLGETPLFLCLNLDNIDAFKILLKYDANCNIQRNDGNSVLHLAINEKKLDFVNILLENGSNPNLINKKNNQTPFHLAIINKIDECMLLKFKENRANGNIKDKFNKTPFDYAIETKDNNYILLINKIFEQKEINLMNKQSIDKNKEKFIIHSNKFKYSPKHPNKEIIIIENNENIDCSNFDRDTNLNTLSEIYSTKDYNITSKNKISIVQDTIKEITINELKDFSLSDSNYKSIKDENKDNSKKDNESDEKDFQRKCLSFVECDSKDLLKNIILDTVKKLNNSQNMKKNTEKKFFTKNLFAEKIFKSIENEDYNKNLTTFENSKKFKALNTSLTNNIISATSSITDEKDSNSNFNQKYINTNKVCNNIIILKDDSSEYNSNYNSITDSIKSPQENNNSIKEKQKHGQNMKYMIMKQIKEKNNKTKLGSTSHISNKVLSKLRNWLISCDLLSYYNLFVEKKFVNIEGIINDIKENKIKVDYKLAEDIGIRKPGHVIRFLLKLQIDSEILDKNLSEIILEKYCNNNFNTLILNSSTGNCKCCGMSCFSQVPLDSCDFNEFTTYINNNDILAFLRSKDLFEFKDNFIHNGFDQVDYIIMQLFSEFKFNKNLLIEFLHIYHETEQKKVIKILYDEKEKICKEINIPFDKKEVEDILSEFKAEEDSFDEKEEEECLIF